MTFQSRVPVRCEPQQLGRDTAERLWTEHKAALSRYLRVLGARGPDIDDLLQETFVLLLQRPFEDRGPTAAGSFLRKTARHLFLRRNRNLLPQVEAADAVWERRCGADDGTGYLTALRTCVEALPARLRRLIALGYDEGLGREAIAREMGMKADGVKTALRRLRTGLKQCIERRVER